MYDVAIIGSGLSGLQCAYLLSKEGLRVCVVDKNDRIGGMIQSFVRDGVVFNTGLNYTESLGEGEVLDRYFNLFGLKNKLTLKQLDKSQSDLITIGDKRYAIPQGHGPYADALKRYFPSESVGIDAYLKGLKEVCHSFPLYALKEQYGTFSMDSPLFQTAASQFINQHATNSDLRAIMAGINILYAGQKDITPLYTHALINYSFIRSAWRIKEGGSGIANVLLSGIKKNGGTVLRNTEVDKVEAKEQRVTHLSIRNGEAIYAKNFISSLHPKTLLTKVDKGVFRNAFYSRISSLEDTVGMFTVYIVLKKNTLLYQNYNHHYFKSDNPWTTNSTDWPQNYMLYTVYNHKTTEYANGLMVLAYMRYDEVSKWAATTVENRGEEYKAFKQQKAEKLIALAENSIPGLRSKIASYYTSTPLTYRDYTGTADGSSYGLVKHYKYPLHGIINTQTRLKNLFLTGQNLNMHGILGVSIGAVLTCSHLLGKEYLYHKLIKN